MTNLQKRNHKRIVPVAIGFAGLLFASAAVASLDGPEDVTDGDEDTQGNVDREPRFEDEGDSLQAALQLRDLDERRRIRAELEATAEVEFECRRYNQRYERELEVELEGVEFYRRRDIEDDRLRVVVETEEAEDALDTRYGYDGGCPDGWDRRIEEVSFLDAKLEIEQGQRSLVTWLCTFDDPTRDGRVRRRNVDCQTLY